MTESKYTPGPWKVTRRGIMAVNPKTGRHGVVVCQPNWRGAEPDDVWLDCPREANARLIAAAPDLLAAAQSALAFVEYCEGGNGEEHRLFCGDELRAAIAKARGEA